MIKKFKEIGNLAVFQNFEWDKSVLDKDNNVLEFKQINILYGRNYSGKTTLSRILRAIENGKISDKFENPSFCVTFNDNAEIKQDALIGHGRNIRVFNDDFIRDNLMFIINPEQSIEPFAILGIDNNRIEAEIKIIEAEVGSKEEGYETGLYSKLKQENEDLKAVHNNHRLRKEQLDSKLSAKATDREIGIKYKFEKFGDQNYTIRKLENDIERVLDLDFKPVAKDEQTKLEKLIAEKINEPIPALPEIILNVNRFVGEAKQLINQKVGKANKIEELAKDAVLNKWVKEGKQLHQYKRKKCAFCDNQIDQNRWSQLEKHFDEESEKLERAIDNLIADIERERVLIASGFMLNKNLFYSKFHPKVERISIAYKHVSEKYFEQMNNVQEQLEERKSDLINPKVYKEESNYTKRLDCIFSIYENLRQTSNNYSSSLNADQVQAKESLRLKEVFDFTSTIKYTEELNAIKELKDKEDDTSKRRDKVVNEIFEKNQQIENKKRELKDESKGAERVNEYLNDFFGHGFLSLKAVEFVVEEETPTKRFRFEVIRDGKKAYHLSEGESSLISFCYFMAKLDDIETKGSKPIIWIDDPISSLDGNHIFFVYSILNSEIVSKNIFEQLFISTHSLDFLKYLKRLTGYFTNQKGNSQEYSKSYFIVSRHDKVASLSLMPKYLKEFVTEFNYLFQQIYKCSKITTIDDTNYTTFYNFGNNARKFLEVYLYYKYPDNSEEIKKLQKFFGGEKIPSVFTDRINNEYSHMSAVFERGAIPVEVPEMKSVAELIIQRIKETDEEQYKSLVYSIGETP